MKIDHIRQFYHILCNDNLSFVYQGDFSDGITEKIIALSEYSIDNSHDMAEMRNKVSFVIVECFQNIVRHGNDSQNSENKALTFPGFFATRNAQECIYISSANLIENTKVSVLKDKLEKLNSLDKEQIKALYLDILSNGELSVKGGAGLGLVEMIRKSENPLEFNFESVNQKLSLFYLMLKMQGKGVINVKSGVSIGSIKEMHEVMRKEDILMVYKGDFSQETVVPMLKIIEDNLNKQEEKLATKKKLFFLLMEILQNISKHAAQQNGKKEAIFMIGKNDHRYIICTGNYADAASSEKIKNKISMVNSLNKIELATLYKKTLIESVSDENGAGLGIIEIARESGEKLVFDLKPAVQDLSFFSLSVQM